MWQRITRAVIFAQIWLALISTTAARSISTSALLTCQTNSEFSAQKFDVEFDPDTRKASIDAQLTSAIDGNFTIEAELYVYGIKILTRSFSGCSLSKTVCPISSGRFDIKSNIDVPSKVIGQIPGVAYTVPDIDAVVRANVYYVDSTGKSSGSSIACVEAQLTNGKTVQHSYVSWILFAVIALGVVVAGIATLLNRVSTAGHIISNVISLFGYFQGVAVIAMMGVYRLPPIAAAWAQNFEWTMGIISVKFMQTIMTWYVRSTGGTPTNVLPNKNIISIAVYKRSSPLMPELAWGFTEWLLPDVKYTPVAYQTANGLMSRALDLSSNTTTTNERKISLDRTLVLRGINRVAYLANIEISNFFLTGATFFIFIGLALVVILGLVKGILELCLRGNMIAPYRFESYRNQWRSYTKGVLFRYFLVGFTQLSVLSLWEFTDRESVATTVDAVVLYAVLLATLCYAAVKVILLAKNSTKIFQNPAYILFGNSEVLNRWGFLYVQFRAECYWFLVALLFFNFVKSAIIALGQANGKVQAVMVFVFDIIYLVLVAWKRPWMDKPTNGFNIAIASISLLNSIFFLFFSQLFGEKADVASSIVGVVFFVVNAAFSAILLVMIVFACIWALLHPNPDARYEPVKDDRNLFMPDLEGEEKTATELDDLGDVARDGHRESYLHYNTYQGSSREDLPGAREQQAAPSAAAMANRPLSGYGQEFYGEPDHYNSYRDFQSSGVLGRNSEIDHFTGGGTEQLVDHSSLAAPQANFYGNNRNNQRRPSGPREFPH